MCCIIVAVAAVWAECKLKCFAARVAMCVAVCVAMCVAARVAMCVAFEVV